MIGSAPAMTAQRGHRYQVRIYYEDTDAGGVVYHANYLRFAERARTEAMREAGVPHGELVSEFKRMFVVRRVKLDYVRPARLDDPLTVLTEGLALGGASTTLRQSFLAADGQPLAVLDIGLACVRLEDGRPARIPPRWHRAFAAMMTGGPAAAVAEET
jgi:acyl-CoA thioester hydrolase